MARVNYTQWKTPTWGQASIDLISQELQAHPAWSLVDTVNSPGGMPCMVFKCSGAVNPLGRDWYLYLLRAANNPISDAQMCIAVSEGYDPVQKMAIRPAPGTGAASTIPGPDGSYGNGAAYPIWLGTSGSTRNNVDFSWVSIANTNGGQYPMDCFVVVTNKGLWYWNSYGTRGSYGRSCYAGWIEPLAPNHPGIITVGNFLSRVNWAQVNHSMYMTRWPTHTTAFDGAWSCMVPSSTAAQWTPAWGDMNGSADRFYNGRPVGGRRALRTGNEGANWPSIGDYLGLWPDLLCIRTSNAGGTSDTVQSGEQTVIYDQLNKPQTYIYAFASNSGTNSLWINISVD